jgi:hypothetical protein
MVWQNASLHRPASADQTYTPEFHAWLDFALALSNVSLSTQRCFNASDEPLITLYHYMANYQSLRRYFLYFLPNLLSYAFVVERWNE